MLTIRYILKDAVMKNSSLSLHQIQCSSLYAHQTTGKVKIIAIYKWNMAIIGFSRPHIYLMFRVADAMLMIIYMPYSQSRRSNSHNLTAYVQSGRQSCRMLARYAVRNYDVLGNVPVDDGHLLM